MKRSFSLFVFIDALGWEIVRNRSFLEEELPYRGPLETVFGYSATCDPTIITGTDPTDHGHFSFFVYDPKHSPFGPLSALTLLPGSIFNRGRVRHWISRAAKLCYGYTGYFQLYAMPFDKLKYFDYTEKHDIYMEGGINGGQPSIFVVMDRSGIPYFLSDWRKSEKHNIEAARHSIRTGSPRMGYLYLAAMDAVLHADGTASERASAMMRCYEDNIRSLITDAREQYEEVRVFVFSDHGMTDIFEICPLMDRIAATGLTFGHDYGVVYDSTMARFWFLTDRAESIIRAALEQEQRGRILDDETLSAWNVDFPDRRYGDLFFLLNPGVLLCPSFLGLQPLKGMHGYDPTHGSSTASFLSSVRLENPPKRLADLFNLMKTEVGL